jgi:Protein of unknown function (DUF2975)
MGRTMIAALRVLLVLLIVGMVAAQLWFFPVLAGEVAEANPEMAWLRWPLLGIVVLVILGAQVTLAAVWVLLSMVERDAVFSTRSLGWVDVIIVATVIDTVLVLGMNVFLAFGVHANPPALMLFLLAATVGGAAFALLMVVMKNLLRKASTFQAELSEVI